MAARELKQALRYMRTHFKGRHGNPTVRHPHCMPRPRPAGTHEPAFVSQATLRAALVNAAALCMRTVQEGEHGTCAGTACGRPRLISTHVGAPDAQGDVEPYAKFMLDTVRSNKDAKEPDVLLKVRLPEPL